VVSVNLENTAGWYASWGLSLPLIIANVMIHVVGLGAISDSVNRSMKAGAVGRTRTMARFVTTITRIVLSITVLHAVEGIIWATAFLAVGAVPDSRTAMLYSINAMTSYGHENIDLVSHWQMMGALEALNGMLLFGLTTAFLFAMIQEVWPHPVEHHQKS
jgi:hypothetical protein